MYDEIDDENFRNGDGGCGCLILIFGLIALFGFLGIVVKYCW